MGNFGAARKAKIIKKINCILPNGVVGYKVLMMLMKDLVLDIQDRLN